MCNLYLCHVTCVEFTDEVERALASSNPTEHWRPHCPGGRTGDPEACTCPGGYKTITRDDERLCASICFHYNILFESTPGVLRSRMLDLPVEDWRRARAIHTATYQSLGRLHGNSQFFRSACSTDTKRAVDPDDLHWLLALQQELVVADCMRALQGPSVTNTPQAAHERNLRRCLLDKIERFVVNEAERRLLARQRRSAISYLPVADEGLKSPCPICRQAFRGADDAPLSDHACVEPVELCCEHVFGRCCVAAAAQDGYLDCPLCRRRFERKAWVLPDEPDRSGDDERFFRPPWLARLRGALQGLLPE
ncbi:hypothetical protein BJ875DRAFT_440547 [Amylocarpus encephaloides]|uniref:RING-type domain-containing protein n=1 Tax=Amylocarpus encephaloides TaxID=45428 RepID=A0A9P7YJW0_9HELO|nr:hypothetical protein BJ875DRAFT_440547 [Amylocarpus encephaloides]